MAKCNKPLLLFRIAYLIFPNCLADCRFRIRRLNEANLGSRDVFDVEDPPTMELFLSCPECEWPSHSSALMFTRLETQLLHSVLNSLAEKTRHSSVHDETLCAIRPHRQHELVSQIAE